MGAEVEDVAEEMDIDAEPGPSAADKGKAPVNNGTDASRKDNSIPWVRWKPFLFPQMPESFGPSAWSTAQGTPDVWPHYLCMFI